MTKIARSEWKKFFVVASITLTIMIFFAFLDFIISAFTYATDPLLRAEYAGYGVRYKGFFDALFQGITGSRWTFDPTIIFGTAIFQLIVPFYGVYAAYDFHRKWTSLYQLEMVSSKKKTSFLIDKVWSTSRPIAFGSLLGFLVFMLFSIWISGGEFTPGVDRWIFSDWFGQAFYENHTYLHWLLEGFVRFFWIPLVYCVFGIGIVSLTFAKKTHVLSPLFYFYGMSVFAMAFIESNQQLYLYLSPRVIMSSGDFIGFNTTLMILVNTIPMLIGLGILWWRISRQDI